MALLFLVVEDDNGLRRSLVRMLSYHGHVEGAVTCAVARTALRARAFDAIIVGIGLVDGKGFELIELARRRVPAVSALVLSDNPDHSLIARAHEYGAQYLMKPCTRRQLDVLAAEALARKTARERRTRVVLERWRADYKLSVTEIELLTLAVDGVKREDFSRLRSVRPDTIRKQIQALLRKTGDETFESAVNSLLREALSEPT
jgi:DNA-binding NarL/FixJ family response regulator